MRVEVQKLITLTGHRDAVYALCHGPEPGQFFSSGGDGLVVYWQITQSENGIAIVRLPAAVYSLQYLPESWLLLAGSRFGIIYQLDTANGVEKNRLQLEGDVFALLALPERDLLLAGTSAGYIYFVGLSDFQVRHTLRPSDKSCRAMALSPDGKTLATGWSDNHIRIYDLDKGEEQYSFLAHENSVFALQYIQQGTRLLSGGRDARLRLWDAGNQYLELKVLPAHWFTVNDIVQESSGEYFFTASRDKSIRIWDTQTQDLLKVLERPKWEGHTHSVNKLLWLGHENMLISGSDDRRIKVWQLDFQPE